MEASQSRNPNKTRARLLVSAYKMNLQPITLYETILCLRQQLADGQAALDAQLTTQPLNFPQLIEAAAAQQRLAVLLLEMLRRLLTSEPELLEKFDERIFDLEFAETLRQTRVTLQTG